MNTLKKYAFLLKSDKNPIVKHLLLSQNFTFQILKKYIKIKTAPHMTIMSAYIILNQPGLFKKTDLILI